MFLRKVSENIKMTLMDELTSRNRAFERWSQHAEVVNMLSTIIERMCGEEISELTCFSRQKFTHETPFVDFRSESDK